MDGATIKERLRQVAMANQMNYFAAAPVSRWQNAPAEHQPTDFLPTAKTVIVMGRRIPRGELAANKTAYDGGVREGIFSYMIFGYNKLNDLLNKALYEVNRLLEEDLGAQNFLIPASTPRDEYQMMGVMSNRHAAVCAGLAAFGWNGLALTPDYGPKVRFCQIVTDLELPYDDMLEPNSLCDREKCRICIDVCPVKAFPETDAHEFTIGDKSIRYAKLNRPLCRTGVTGLAKGSAGRLQAQIPPGVSRVEDWLEIAKGDDRYNKAERVASMCGRCMTQCPVGLKNTRSHPKQPTDAE
jgi:epoxyqueuosine reductase QueG